MSSELKADFHSRAKRFHGFTGVASLFADENGDQICIVCATQDVLFEKLKEFMPSAEISGARFQTVTIIKAE